MKIAMMIKYVRRDGVCLSVVNLAVGLRQLGHEVVVIAGDGPGRDLVEAEKIPLYLAPIDRPVTGWLRAYRDACRWLRQWNADIVHTHYRYANIVGKLVARRLGIPHVSTLHTGRVPDSRLRVKLSCWGSIPDGSVWSLPRPHHRGASRGGHDPLPPGRRGDQSTHAIGVWPDRR